MPPGLEETHRSNLIGPHRDKCAARSRLRIQGLDLGHPSIMVNQVF
jgi:hypothetical protein